MTIYTIYFLIGYIYGMYVLFYGTGTEKETLRELAKFGVRRITRGWLTFIRFFAVFISVLAWPVDMVYDIFVFTKKLLKRK